MSLTLKIETKDYASETLHRLEASLKQPQQLNQYVADSCTAITRSLFAQLGVMPNAHAWKPTGFWRRMAAGTVAVATGDAATVRMPRKVAQRYFGGTLTPTGGRKWLAIPARQEPYGIMARDFPGLKFVPLGRDRAMLVQETQTVKAKGARKRKDGSFRTLQVGGGAFYFLVKSVTQTGDKSVLPSDQAYFAAARAGLNAYISKFNL